MRLKVLVGVAVLLLAVGCSGQKDRHQTQKETATKQWNSARAAVLVGLARDQYNSGNFDKARLTVTDALKLNPDNSYLHVLSGKLAIEQGQLELAERELRQAGTLDPKNAEADYLLGVVYQRWQKPETAFGFYESASDKAPAELAYVMARAEMLVSMDRGKEALTILSEKVVYFEHSAVIRDAVGQLLVGEKRYTDAVEMLRQASILANDDLTIREHLSLALYYNKNYREAADSFSRLVADAKYANRADLFLALGECQLQIEKPIDARASFETASQLEPANVHAWTSLAKVALARGDSRRAEMSLKRAISLDASASEAYLLMGYLQLRESRFPEAMTSFQKASALDQTDPVSLCMAGYVFEKTGQHERAIQLYAKALKLKPGDELATKLMASVDMRE